MPLSVVSTPDGTMRVAGRLRPVCALITDLIMCVVLVLPMAHRAEINDSLTAAIWTFGIVGYALLAFRGVVPSLGRWALGLRSYPYDMAEKNAGKGTLYVYEDFSSWVYTQRSIAAVLLLGALFGLAFLIAGIVSGSSA